MTLIKSNSGIRGTIGGPAGDTLNPLDIVKFTSAYATFIRRSGASKSNTIVVGRDARISGEMVKNVVCGTLMGMVDGKATTIEQVYHVRDLLRIELQEVIDWSEVEVDTKVTVWNKDYSSFKRKRYLENVQ